MESTAPTTGYSTFSQRITHNLGQASFFIKNCMRKMNLVRLSLVANIWKIVANTEYDTILNLRPTLAHHESGDFVYFCSARCRDQRLFPSCQSFQQNTFPWLHFLVLLLARTTRLIQLPFESAEPWSDQDNVPNWPLNWISSEVVHCHGSIKHFNFC